MSDTRSTKSIHGRTPESAAMSANIKRAMAITARLNLLTYGDAEAVRTLFSELIGKKVDETLLLIPPFYTAGGDEIRVGRNVFVNQNCTLLRPRRPRHRGRCVDRAECESHHFRPSP
jgi:acetyltransferase-like isoleucine patch superfamily enzyme